MLENKSMSGKFIKSFILFIVIPFITMTVIVNVLYEKVLVSHYNEKVQQVMEQLSADLENEIKRISLNVAKVSNEEDLMYLVSCWYDETDSVKKLELYTRIEAKLDYLFAYPGDINSILFFSDNSKVLKYKYPFYKNEDEVRQSFLYKECTENKDKVFSENNFSNFKEGSNNTVEFLFGISPRLKFYGTDTKFIYFEVKTEVFNSIYSRFINDKVGKMVIVDENGKIIISPDKKLLGKNISEIDYLNEGNKNSSNFYKYRSQDGIQYISKYTSKESGWSVIDIIDYNALTKDTSNIMKIILVIFIIFILLFILYSKFFFKDIIKPIKDLIHKMNKVQEGNLDEVVNLNSNLDEIWELGCNYNKMVNDIKQLMLERDLKERQRSQEEIKALQAQINPHFIYNTLNVIKLMAAISKAEGIRSVTDSFMKLLSLIFKSESTFITVKEELEYLDNYAEIMKARLGDNFNIVVNVDEEVKNLYIIKLVLQPIVENAIIHGVNELDENKDIFITGYIEKDRLILEVKDNGIGMDEEQIKKIFESDETSKRSFNSIGIKNTEKRIKLNCGEEYGIRIKSEKNKFTKVKLILPVRKEQEN